MNLSNNMLCKRALVRSRIVPLIFLSWATLCAAPNSKQNWHEPISEEQLATLEHPRLLATSQRLAKIKEFYNSEAGHPTRLEFEAYLKKCKIPEKAAFLKDATDGQRQGLWNIPTLSLHYLITGSESSRDATIAYLEWLNNFEHWEEGKEVDSGMSAANIMVGAAIGFDSVYHDLEPDFRETFRKKIWHHATELYRRGHQGENPASGYWINDPFNNHRWHRNAGLTLSVLAATTGTSEEIDFIKKVLQELDYIYSALPADGSSHESPSYMVFGLPYLMLALDAADRNLGQDYLEESSFINNVSNFRIQSLAPNLKHAFTYGDDSGKGYYNNAFYLPVAKHNQSDHQVALDAYRKNFASPFSIPWMRLLWRDSELPRGSVENIAHETFFEDLGLLFVRDGWEAQDTALMFKSSPLGGHSLNAFRDNNGKGFVNVAHSDPDANMFVLWNKGAFVAENDRYSKHKQSANHNTILVDGIGQTSIGKEEGAVWSQPPANGVSMQDTAFVTAYKSLDGIVAIEGEAANAYSHVDLDTFRRTLIWNEGNYILVIDSIESPEPHEFSWLIQSPRLTAFEEYPNNGTLFPGPSETPFVISSNAPYESEIVQSTADNRGKPLGWQQLRLSANTSNWFLVSLYQPWDAGSTLSVKYNKKSKSATITIKKDDEKDAFKWKAAKDENHSSQLSLKNRNGNRVILDGSERKHH
ncbi:heparinase II/III-family protein [Puniceicoccaceae bacterium K14]|nr:heparinase II/III-family protein [Puniceicoccaceae bacterium K14]